MTELDGTVILLGEAYGNWKSWEKAKDRYKDEFFELITEQLSELCGQPVRVRTYPGKSEAAARIRALLHNPGWLISSTRPSEHPELGWDFVMNEDAALLPFAIVVEGVKYGRSVAKGPVMVDDDWLAEDDPDLYTEVTYKLPWGVVITRPIETLSAETIARLGKYIYNGKPRVSLAVREVKPDVEQDD